MKEENFGHALARFVVINPNISMMSKNKYIPTDKKKISKKEIDKKMNFKAVLKKVNDELKGNLALV